ncbi:MAG: hypothetical protein NTW12_13425 [Deltaproteobacteria bacterium]|nr:hypothetical protein [Deltaproteobacteria bacterium]
MKRFLWILALVFFSFTSSWAGTFGDVNDDGQLNLADAVLALQVITGISPQQTVYREADVNGDAKIGLDEVIYILQTLAGLRPAIIGPDAPTGVSAVASNAQVILSWTAVTGATSYNIYWSASSGVTKANGTKISNIAKSPYKHTKLANGSAYYYIVTANSGSEESAPSVEVSVKPTVVVKISFYNSGDVLTAYATYDYDAAGHVVKTTSYAAGLMAGYITMEYNVDGKVTKSSSYGPTNELMQYTTIEYNADGKVTKISIYDLEGDLMMYTTKEYNTGGMLTKTSTYNGYTNVLSAYSTYEYNADGKETKSSTYNVTDLLTSYTTTEYNADGKVTRTSNYNGFSNLLTGYTEYGYDAKGNIISITKNDMKEKPSTDTIINEYNESGLPVKISIYSGVTGLLESYTTMEYMI